MATCGAENCAQNCSVSGCLRTYWVQLTYFAAMKCPDTDSVPRVRCSNARPLQTYSILSELFLGCQPVSPVVGMMAKCTPFRCPSAQVVEVSMIKCVRMLLITCGAVNQRLTVCTRVLAPLFPTHGGSLLLSAVLDDAAACCRNMSSVHLASY